ncbi:hypothetical protein EV702DRAFT_1182516 [Suillus placidus]|uniref:Uncharacterized protein n=1 Tax=Suillus placidus TaxID=48579 RepID=A0A9P6ZGI4_9AGAM|nr:hypothetical protein EV702DRAFT_1182516 [Suillus placidus]
MDDEYDVWYRDPHLMAHNMLANPTYKKEIDYTPFHEYDAADNTCQWKDFMSGDWAWQQADEISKDPNTHGSVFLPIILGSAKTTVSVGMGNNEYYPLYAMIGIVHNNVWHAHCDALFIIGFLAIPKTNRKDAKEDIFWNFCCQLFHHSLSVILTSLKPGMTQYEVLRYGDADYEEQIVLSCTVKNWCPKCLALQLDLDGSGIYCSHELVDLLISELPGDTYWFEFGVNSHIVVRDETMSDIDRRIAAVASFSGLWQFHEGCDFRQWTGNDSKALMKVFILAIKGHVPQEMQIQDALTRFHHYHQIFETSGTVPHFLLPCQHLMIHYHIKANNALGQMLLCNQWLNKLAAS